MLLGKTLPAKPLLLDLAAMAPATPPSHARPGWQVPLLVGVCFGIGYGFTQRLLSLQLIPQVRLDQRFEVRPFPGTSLESLRLRFGAEDQEIRGDADPLPLEPQSAPEPEAHAVPVEAPSLEAPPPPDLPGADLPQSTPAAGPQ